MSTASAAIRQVIFELPVLPVPEGDRDLLDPEPLADGAVGQLDLERVAVGADGRKVERPQHLGPEALEAARDVTHPDPEHPAGVPGAPTGDELAEAAPVAHPAARHVAGAEHQIGVPARRLEQAGEIGGIVGEVRVHLHDEARVLLERAGEAGQVGGPEPVADRPVEHPQRRELGSAARRRPGPCRPASRRRPRGSGAPRAPPRRARRRRRGRLPRCSRPRRRWGG